MLKRLATFIAGLAIVLLPICMPIAVQAQGDFGLKQTVDSVNKGQAQPIYNTKDSSPGVLIGKIIASLLEFVGVIFFLLMIYAGVIWMTAQGDTEKVAEAKNTIKAAIIGMVVVGGAYAITSFVLRNASGQQPEASGGAGTSTENPTPDPCELDSTLPGC